MWPPRLRGQDCRNNDMQCTRSPPPLPSRYPLSSWRSVVGVLFQFSCAGTDKPPPYYHKLNSWLGQVLQREADMISIEVCETETHGIVLRYCPLEGSILDEARAPELQAAVEAQMHVLTATVELREPFQQKVTESPLLRLVHVPGWAGLGGVRYVPSGWDDAETENLNELNKKLVDTLRATDGAFSCGDGDDGMACVRFGMVTADTDVEELLQLVLAAGREVEDTSRALSTMSEVLKKGTVSSSSSSPAAVLEARGRGHLARAQHHERGIEEAEADLSREQYERLWQQGVLGRVPVVGRVVQWWAPPAPARGRRLQLASGRLQPTDDVYKYVQKKSKDDGEPARSHSPARPAQ
ncbi:unnamed protein product [Plutella xylostella]|uniref:(diamondback moth) hypothetical protein n=1 Tax=Plutella xylostella TaxID=51655 RepID=A0A8S4G417_PLUXY|nr:unnamed protein product [Plutella xylostella]